MEESQHQHDRHVSAHGVCSLFCLYYDRPGHVDFTVEVERSARVLDGSVVVIDAVSGVQAQTRTVWKQIRKQNLPSIAFINKMDRYGADFERAIVTIKSKLGANPIAIQIPTGTDEKFSGVVDLISMHKIVWSDKMSKKPEVPTRSPLDESDPLYAAAVEARASMLEAVAEVDEVFMERYFEREGGGPELTQSEIIQALRRQCIAGSLVPVVCGASLRGKGVEPLLDCVVAFLPSPADRPEMPVVHCKNGEIKRISSKTNDLCAFAFKVVHDDKRGPLTYCRVFSGSLNGKQSLFNVNQSHKERVNQLLHVSADDLDTISDCSAGGICCIVGLKHTRTGDTLVVDKGPLHSYVLDGLTVPKPVFSIAIEPEKSIQQTDLDKALAIMCVEDPSLQVHQDQESGLTMLRGIGELHLEIVVDKLRRQYGLNVITGDAYVGYREGLQMGCDVQGVEFTYDRTIGPRRMFAKLTFDVSVFDHTEEATFELAQRVKEQIVPEELNAMTDALKGALSRGPKGYPVVGLNVKVIDITKDHDTTPGAIRACVAMFVDQMLRTVARQMFEPIMDMEIELPPSFVGDILSDLTQRRAIVKEIQSVDANRHTITAQVPLATILGYATTLRSRTQGEGSFSVEYSCLSPVDEYDVMGKK